MPRGRPRKPHRLRVLEGGRGKSRPLTPDLPAPSSPLAEPAGLTDAERKEWKRHAAYIRKLGVESEVDSSFFEGMIVMLCRFRAAKAIINKSGMTMVSAKGNVVKRPEVSIARESLQAYERMAAAFGITPAARAKLGGSGGARERAGDVPSELRDAKRR